MIRARVSESMRTLTMAAGVVAIAAAGLWFGVRPDAVDAKGATNLVPAATFAANAGTLGAIADATACAPTPGTPKEVTFTTSGVTGTVTSVDISMTFGGPNHTWMGDIVATLIAPNGASHTVFGVTGSTTATGIGDSSDLGAAYTFSDTAPAPPNGGWWQAATAAGAAVVIPTGTYRTTGSGGAGQTNPAPPTNMNAAFSGVANANGTWTLRLTDGCNGDTGAVSAATLSVVGSAPPVALDANTDMDGDGKTDFVVARGTSTPLTEGESVGMTRPGRNRAAGLDTREAPGTKTSDNALAPPIYWYTQINGSATTGVGQLGDAATDFIMVEDYDGDGKDDLSVWTPGLPTVANFKILESSTNTVRVELFGQEGDDPAVVGDYDGDGKADVAVFRCPAFGSGDGQCFFFYRGSNANPGGNVTYVPWGFGEDGDFFPYVGDFDGDGKNDFCIQRANPSSPTNGQFVLLKSADLGVEYINWGNSSDFLIPGDYDGDGKTDLCVRRTESGLRQHYLLTRTGATSQVHWGVTGDVSTPGDYDGDGKTDFAVWRANADPTQNFFYVRRSSDLGMTQFEWGQQNDVPAAGWLVH